MIIADTSGLIALLNDRDACHREVSAAVAASDGPFLVSPFVLTELDYIVLSRWGVHREKAMLATIRATCELAPFDASDLDEAIAVIEKYEDHEIGLADASMVVMAHRHRTRKILTLDHRHFRVLRGPGGKPFTILPAP